MWNDFVFFVYVFEVGKLGKKSRKTGEPSTSTTVIECFDELYTLAITFQ